jgi:hypothetical protein
MEVTKEGVKIFLARARKHCWIIWCKTRKAACDKHIIVIAICTGIATFVSVRWDGIGGLIVSSGASFAKDATAIIMDIEVIIEEGEGE